MKKIIGVIVLAFFIATLYLYKTSLIAYADKIFYQSPCDSPLTYKLGSVDPKFNISNQDFLNDIDSAGQIWSRAEGKNLFSYQINGAITINLIYDQRQLLNTQINSLNSDIKNKQQTLTPEIASYRQKAAQFKSDLNQLNHDIDYWNAQGGAPPDEYDKLKSRQQALQQEAKDLQQQAISLNQSTDAYNSQVGELNQTVDSFNTALQYKPEEGEYIYDNGTQTLDIYFDNSQSELIHTLAHEMGHALGMGHNNNPASIMYPRTTTALTPSSSDIGELTQVCKKRNVGEIYAGRFATIIRTIQSRF